MNFVTPVMEHWLKNFMSDNDDLNRKGQKCIPYVLDLQNSYISVLKVIKRKYQKQVRIQIASYEDNAPILMPRWFLQQQTFVNVHGRKCFNALHGKSNERNLPIVPLADIGAHQTHTGALLQWIFWIHNWHLFILFTVSLHSIRYLSTTLMRKTHCHHFIGYSF